MSQDAPKNSPFQVRLPLFIALALAAGILIGANGFKAAPAKRPGYS